MEHIRQELRMDMHQSDEEGGDRGEGCSLKGAGNQPEHMHSNDYKLKLELQSLPPKVFGGKRNKKYQNPLVWALKMIIIIQMNLINKQ